MIISLALASSLIAQTPVAQPAQRDVMLGHFHPLAVLETDPSRLRRSWVYSMYAPSTASPREGGVRYVVWRRAMSRGSEPDIVEWARVSDCPGAETSMTELEEMALPRVDVPLIGREDTQGPPLDGVTYRLWFRNGKWPDGFAYSASVSSNIGTPLSGWADRFFETMEPCWTSETPVAWNSNQR